jgi:hypothetical protein
MVVPPWNEKIKNVLFIAKTFFVFEVCCVGVEGDSTSVSPHKLVEKV